MNFKRTFSKNLYYCFAKYRFNLCLYSKIFFFACTSSRSPPKYIYIFLICSMSFFHWLGSSPVLMVFWSTKYPHFFDPLVFGFHRAPGPSTSSRCTHTPVLPSVTTAGRCCTECYTRGWSAKVALLCMSAPTPRHTHTLTLSLSLSLIHTALHNHFISFLLSNSLLIRVSDVEKSGRILICCIWRDESALKQRERHS